MNALRPISLTKPKLLAALMIRTKSIYSQFHNILRLFNVLPNFRLTTNEAMGDYYLKTWYIRVASRDAERLKT